MLRRVRRRRHTTHCQHKHLPPLPRHLPLLPRLPPHHAPARPSPAPPPFQAIPLPKGKLQQVIQASERTQVPYDARLCNFAPPKDLEALQALLAEKVVVVNGNDRSGVQITEGGLPEVEREAERRLWPFACGVDDCQRRYKNMNGLRTSLPSPRYCPHLG